MRKMERDAPVFVALLLKLCIYDINKIHNKIINVNVSGFHRVALSSTVSRSNWNLEMLVFVEGGKPEYPEKNPRSRDENQQQTQPTYDMNTGNQTWATLVEGECSHHCAIPAPFFIVMIKLDSLLYYICFVVVIDFNSCLLSTGQL